MKEGRLVGLDIGTSGLKITLADDSGRITDHLKYKYELVEWAPGVVPLTFYFGIVQKVLSSLAQKYFLISISVSTQMYSICRWTKDGIAVLQWNCIWPRAREESDFAKTLFQSGCPADTLYGGYKLLSTPPGERKDFLTYGLKEALIELLTGELATDYTTASASGLFKLADMDWNREILEQNGFDPARLARVCRHNQPVGNLRGEAFAGADANTLVVPGLGDGPSASYACRDVSNFCGNIGTSMACRVFTESPDLSQADKMWIYAVDPQTSIVGGISSNSCTVFHWANRLGFDTIDQLCETGDLMLVPWIYGERMPYWSSDLKGVLLGLMADTTREQISCAAQKAVAFTMAAMVHCLNPFNNNGDPLVLAGGGTHSKGVLEVIAGSVQSDLAILEDADYLCSTGSVISAGEGVGIQVQPKNKLARLIHADGSYLTEYTRWRAACEAMSNFYHAKQF